MFRYTIYKYPFFDIVFTKKYNYFFVNTDLMFLFNKSTQTNSCLFHVIRIVIEYIPSQFLNIASSLIPSKHTSKFQKSVR